jgi:plastocyanin
MRRHRYLITCTAIGLGLSLAGCGDGPSASAQAPVATSAISIQDNRFEPEAAEVAVGETVTWTWEGNSEHNVVGDGFESDVQRDGSFTQRFDQAGTYDYRCTLHSGMQGTIIVGDGGGASAEGR